MAGLDYTVTLASSMENALSRWKTFSLPPFLPRFFSLARVDPRRRAKPHKGNIADRASTASSPSQVPPRRPGFLALPSLFFTRPPPCSSRRPSRFSVPLDAQIYSAVTFRSTRNEFVDRVRECLVISFWYSFSSLGYLHSAAGLFCRFNTHRMFECIVNNLSILFALINCCIYTFSPS